MSCCGVTWSDVAWSVVSWRHGSLATTRKPTINRLAGARIRDSVSIRFAAASPGRTYGSAGHLPLCRANLDVFLYLWPPVTRGSCPPVTRGSWPNVPPCYGGGVLAGLFHDASPKENAALPPVRVD